MTGEGKITGEAKLTVGITSQFTQLVERAENAIKLAGQYVANAWVRPAEAARTPRRQRMLGSNCLLSVHRGSQSNARETLDSNRKAGAFSEPFASAVHGVCSKKELADRGLDLIRIRPDSSSEDRRDDA